MAINKVNCAGCFKKEPEGMTNGKLLGSSIVWMKECCCVDQCRKRFFLCSQTRFYGRLHNGTPHTATFHCQTFKNFKTDAKV